MAKIRRNVERDNEVNRQLGELGWIVIRFWEDEIKKEPDACVGKVADAIQERIQCQI
jgi:DNA mismatch endonuclease (patch repair protein)